MDPVLGVAGGVLTLLGVIASAWFTHRASNRKLRTDFSQQMIDQLQQEVERQAKDIAALQKIQRIQGDYIGSLRRHIADGQPPPPPPFPSGLIT